MQITNIISCITYNNTGIGKAVLLSLYTNRETEMQSAYATSRNQQVMVEARTRGFDSIK